MIQNEIYYKSLNCAKRFDNTRLIKDIEQLERLIDNDDFRESIFIDQAFEMYDAYRDECVRRIKNSLAVNYGGVSTLATCKVSNTPTKNITVNINNDNNGEINIRGLNDEI